MGLLGWCVLVLQLATGVWTIALARSGSDMAAYARRVHWGVLVVFFVLGALQSRSGIMLPPLTFFPDNVKSLLVIGGVELALLVFPGDYIRRGNRAAQTQDAS